MVVKFPVNSRGEKAQCVETRKSQKLGGGKVGGPH
jgi:hypothetical protein